MHLLSCTENGKVATFDKRIFYPSAVVMVEISASGYEDGAGASAS